MKGKFIKKLLLVMITCLWIVVPINVKSVDAFSGQIIQRGARGDDVVELQARLQNIGYYHGKIDGVFGWETYWCLRKFQSRFELPIDGLAGATTKAKLVKASNFNKKWVHQQIDAGREFTYYQGTPIKNQVKYNKKTTSTNKTTNTKKVNKSSQSTAKSTKTKQKSTNTPQGYSEGDIQLMANAVYGESRGESFEGQVAVAAVILNRVESASFPNSVSGVIFEPGAFTAVSDGQIWLTPNTRAKEAVTDAINGWDPTQNAIYYFNPDTATSKWIWSRPQIKKIGKHIFCR